MVVLAMEMQGPAENMSPIPERLSRNGWFAAYVRRVRDQLGSLMQEHASPGRLGMAVAFGVMMGCSPFLGLQLLLGVALATVFRLNRIAVILGAQVSVPPITALVFLANAQVGSIPPGRLAPRVAFIRSVEVAARSGLPLGFGTAGNRE